MLRSCVAWGFCQRKQILLDARYGHNDSLLVPRYTAGRVHGFWAFRVGRVGNIARAANFPSYFPVGLGFDRSSYWSWSECEGSSSAMLSNTDLTTLNWRGSLSRRRRACRPLCIAWRNLAKPVNMRPGIDLLVCLGFWIIRFVFGLRLDTERAHGK